MPTLTLKEAWNYAVNYFPNIDHEKADAVYDEIVLLYMSPDRFYHTIFHIENMIRSIEQILKIYTFKHPEQVKAELFFAAFFHDVVYNPQSHDQIIEDDYRSDEVLSAEAAIVSLKKMGLEVAESLEHIYELIILTENHQVDKKAHCPTLQQKIFFDADMSILGDIDPKYDEYKLGCWKEYQHIDPERFIAGRSDFLSHLLDKKAIFYTEYMNQVYGNQAFINIKAELSELDRMNAEALIKSIKG